MKFPKDNNQLDYRFIIPYAIEKIYPKNEIYKT